MPLSRSLLSRRISISFRDQGKTTPEADSYESPMLPPSSDMAGPSSWSAMLPELLGEIIRRVEESEDQWPQRRDVVTCACVSKQWRGITQDIVRSPNNSGKITFPSCLKLVCFLAFFFFSWLIDYLFQFPIVVFLTSLIWSLLAFWLYRF